MAVASMGAEEFQEFLRNVSPELMQLTPQPDSGAQQINQMSVDMDMSVQHNQEIHADNSLSVSTGGGGEGDLNPPPSSPGDDVPMSFGGDGATSGDGHGVSSSA
jgi:hypothetical protein